MTGLLMPTPRRWATRHAEEPESWVAARPRTAAAGGRPQAGLEDVEKVVTDSDRQQRQSVMSTNGWRSGIQGIQEPGGIGLIHEFSYLVRGEPRDLLGFARCERLAACDSASEDEGNDAIPHVLVDA